MSNITNCPFCGKKAKLAITSHTLDGPGYSCVVCTFCGVAGPIPDCARYPTKKIPDRKEAEEIHDTEAIELWNKRCE